MIGQYDGPGGAGGRRRVCATSADEAMATGRPRVVLGVLAVPELVEVGDVGISSKLWCGVGFGVSHSSERASHGSAGSGTRPPAT